jgi:hypothetical protein
MLLSTTFCAIMTSKHDSLGRPELFIIPADLSCLDFCTMGTSATINASFANYRLRYCPFYGRKHLGSKQSDSLRDGASRSDHACGILFAWLLCE